MYFIKMNPTILILMFGASLITIIIGYSIEIFDESGLMYDQFGCDFFDLSYCGWEFYFSMFALAAAPMGAWIIVFIAIFTKPKEVKQ